MNIFKKYIYLFFLLIAVILNYFIVITNIYGMAKKNHQTYKSEFNIKIETKFRKYSIGQPIYINISLRNLSDKNILLNKRCTVGVELVFDITKPPGTKAQLKQLIYLGTPTSDDFMILRSKEVFESVINIIDYYNLDEIGNYVVQVQYKPYNGTFESAWSGIVESNTVAFLIVNSSL